MTTPNEELKPCPFCGSEDAMILLDRDIADECAVFCETHGCVIGPHGKTGMEATELWNRRAQSPPVAQVEVYRKALESALKAFECVRANDKTVYNYKGDGAKNRDGLTLEEGRWATPLEIATDEMKLIQALLTSKPEPVAQGHDGNCVPVRTPDDGWKCDCGYAPVAPAGKWGPALDKEKVLDWLESQVWSCRDTQEKAGWNDAVWTLNGLVRDGKFDLSPEAQDAMIRGGKRKPE